MDELKVQHSQGLSLVSSTPNHGGAMTNPLSPNIKSFARHIVHDLRSLSLLSSPTTQVVQLKIDH